MALALPPMPPKPKEKKMSTGVATGTRMEKYERVLEKLNAVLKAIDDSEQETFEQKVTVRMNREYIKDIKADIIKNKRSLSESEVKGLNKIWKSYKDEPKTENQVERMKEKIRKLAGLPTRKGGNLLEEAISDANETRRLAVEQAKAAMEETFNPRMGRKPPPPPPPPSRQGSPKIKESELRRIIHEAMHEIKSPVKTTLEEKMREIIKEELQELHSRKKKKRNHWI